MIRLLLLALPCALLARVADAAPKICDDTKPENCVQALEKGEPAPFAGQLNTTSLQIDLSLKAESCAVLIDMEVGYERKKLEMDLKLEQHLRDEDRQEYERALAAVMADRDRWREAAQVPFYREPWFVALLTAAVTGGIVVATAKLSQ